ncbi:MAG: TIGR02301 family protein [Pseudomonadota bacterium]
MGLSVCAAFLTTNQRAAFAQSAETPPKEKTTAPALPEVVAPYDDKLLRLSEVLGSIHYLRKLCRADEGMKWRDTMAAILKSEQPQDKRRARLIARFNRGYNAFSEVYAHCTPSAVVAADRYLKEGVRLSSQITTRYGR